jgi:hypothetical protein
MAPSRARRTVAATIVLVLWGLITHGTYAGSGDEAHYHVIAHSTAFDRDFDVANDYAERRQGTLEGPLEPEAHALVGKGGHLRPVHDVGLPLLFSPYYWLAYRIAQQAVVAVPARWLKQARLNGTVLLRHLLSLLMILVTAAIGVGLFGVFLQMSGNTNQAAGWTLLLVLSPPLLSHAFLFFTEILSASLAFWVFLRLRRPHVATWEAALAGAATGYLLLVHVRNVGLVIALVALGLYRFSRADGDRRRAVWFAAAALLMFLARTFVTYRFWGTWLTTPHARFEPWPGWRATLVEMMTRTLGGLFDQEHGLLPYAPIYLLLPFGWWTLWKRDRHLCVQLSLLIGVYLLVTALPSINPHGWRGGWSPAARFLVPVTPFLAILVFAGVGMLRRVPAAVSALVVSQLSIDLVVWQHPKLLWNDGHGVSALLAYLDGGTARLSAHLPSFVPPVGASPLAPAALFVGLWVAYSGWLARTLPSTATSQLLE